MGLRQVVMSTVVVLWTAQVSGAELATIAARSDYRTTGRYEEVERLCTAYQTRWPKHVRCFEFGRSPEGRTMWAIVAATDGVLTSPAARTANKPVVLMQGGIHAGEIDGKDAGFWALRELMEGRENKGVLDQVTFVFVPVLNVDGHERFGRWNRPNQSGPEESGWRTTAHNLNLNRDYVKADAPELHAMLKLLNEWDPILYVDLHATNGAEFEHDISFNVNPTQAGEDAIRRVGVQLRDALMERTRARGSLPLDFYPSFVRDDDPTSGVEANVPPARFSHQYWATRNRLGVLVETHSWKAYPTRVRITRNAIHDMLALAADHGREWRQAAAAADQQARRIGGSERTLEYINNDEVRMIDFRGYEYTREPSAISGGLLTRYNNKRPQIWRIPLKEEVKSLTTVVAPNAGYVIPAAHAQWVQEKLQLHNIEFRPITSNVPNTAVQTFRANATTISPTTSEGRTPIKLKGEWLADEQAIPAGSLFVPIAQSNSELVLTLLEPASPDSLVSWGFFNAFFERKEYMEAYVAESVATEMLKKDPQLREEFQRRLSNDPAFARDPNARLEFFYRRHPSWDERYNLYPVYRLDAPLPGRSNSSDANESQ